jgi:hypothetical protein
MIFIVVTFPLRLVDLPSGLLGIVFMFESYFGLLVHWIFLGILV